MNVLITGGAGFIGSSLAAYLLERGLHVKVIDNLSTGRIENIEPLRAYPHFSFELGTVTDKAALAPLIAWCDHCYHLAAPVGVRYIMERPVLTILENIRGIDVVLELIYTYNKKVLVASTSEVYGRSLDLLDPTGERKLSEEDYRVEGSTIHHRWAYANTKALDEFLAFAYHKEFGTEVVVVRFFNTVGPRQLSAYGMVIPNFVQCALTERDVVVYGTGEQKRSFLHVNDAVRAVTQLMNAEKAVGRVFNLGSPAEISINELAKRIITLCNSPSKIQYVSYEAAYGQGFEDMRRRTADISRLLETIDFEIKYALDDVLQDVIDYQRSIMKQDARLP